MIKPEAQNSILMRLKTLAELIRFSHTLFALPWAVAGLFLGSQGWPRFRVLGLVVLAMAAARTAAMLFNRLVDRPFDATNPRTQNRPSVTGAASLTAMRVGIVLSALVFGLTAYALAPICGALSLPVLAVLLGYSYAKRFTAAAHWILGAALGLAPVAAHIAAEGQISLAVIPALWLGAAVLFWTGGFDILYACQDLEHDRQEGLHSIPASLGIAGALVVARLSHALVPVALGLAALAGEFGLVYWCGVIAVVVLLVAQHRLVKPSDLSRVNQAFFHANVLISLIMMFALAIDQVRGD